MKGDLKLNQHLRKVLSTIGDVLRKMLSNYVPPDGRELVLFVECIQAFGAVGEKLS